MEASVALEAPQRLATSSIAAELISTEVPRCRLLLYFVFRFFDLYLQTSLVRAPTAVFEVEEC